MRYLTILLALFATSVAHAQDYVPPAEPLTAHHRQLLLVRSTAWYASSGTLERYAKAANGDWQRVGPAITVNLGRHGMAWGRGVHSIPDSGPRKREGDGKSPAGAFALGRAFGAANALPDGSLDFPYLQTLPSTYCVEDVRSEFYNRIIDAADVSSHQWQKWSELRRSDGLFDWGIVVRQNAEHPSKGAGSCVFIHLWKGPHRPTAGCTAMAREPLEEILRWLDPKSRPLLVQLPEKTYQALREPWGLP